MNPAGCPAWTDKPAWRQHTEDPPRMLADVSAVADPETAGGTAGPTLASGGSESRKWTMNFRARSRVRARRAASPRPTPERQWHTERTSS
ncbi:hypothetical protein GCM10011578_016390 [Streptomyces fuscichromogenes]|uniref:Uncharacterized protein n=1 Tax=Streptomyces fuscichromogenes TaxID=1324013 RepID=A0A917X9I8_9ACTN|nr:hypothetical protein GCM10011578_016390 [Streptomyces fuscichromogenes]